MFKIVRNLDKINIAIKINKKESYYTSYKVLKIKPIYNCSSTFYLPLA